MPITTDNIDFESTLTKKLTLFSLNIAHGRCNSVHQLLQSSNQIHFNLDQIAEVLIRESPDIVALQEVDYNSFWNGRFDHITYLAEKAGYQYYFSGNHTNRLQLSYGTALLSKYPLTNQVSLNLVNYRLLPAKGLVSATILVNDLEIDVTSLHLDFTSNLLRKKQIEQLTEHQQSRKRTCIIMGDFNADYQSSNSVIRKISEILKLTSFKPENSFGGTFRFTKKRLDWILVPEEIQFLSYRHLDDILSDHMAIVADLSIKVKDN